MIMLNKQFLKFISENNPVKITFEKNGESTPYGRRLFCDGFYYAITATTEDEIKIIHPFISINEKVYEELKKAKANVLDMETYQFNVPKEISDWNGVLIKLAEEDRKNKLKG